jgi:hypothetical protein
MIPAAPAMCILSGHYVLHDYLAGIPICRMECLCKESKSVCVPLIGSTGLCFAVPSPDAELPVSGLSLYGRIAIRLSDGL